MSYASIALVYQSTAAGQSCFLNASLPLFFNSVASASVPMAAMAGELNVRCEDSRERKARVQGRAGKSDQSAVFINLEARAAWR